MIDPDQQTEADSHIERGHAFLQQEDYKAAISEYKKAISVFNCFGSYYCFLSDAYIKNREYRKALLLWDAVEHIELRRIFDKEAFIKPKREEVLQKIEEAKIQLQIAMEILPYIVQTPGVLQKTLYGKFGSFRKDDISFLLWFLDKRGRIRRVKSGNSYLLFLGVSADNIISDLRNVVPA